MKHLHPTPEACESVAQTLEHACDHLENLDTRPILDMVHCDINRGSCCTVACHAGHFLLAHYIENPESRIETNYDEFTGPAPRHDGSIQLEHEEYYLDAWSRGATLIAERLGFRYDYSDSDKVIQWRLKSWADQNPDLWGNQNGYEMFAYPTAFPFPACPDNDDAVRLIATHWRDVGNRIREKYYAP